ncbi:hypothetical protein ILUMI_12762, partial [Ignelater luminosus]
LILPLPKPKDVSGPRIVLFRWNNCDPDVSSLVDISKVYFMVLDILMVEDDNSTISGKAVLGDFRNFSVNYILQFTPSHLKKSMTCMQSAYPIRIKGMYVTYAPIVFEKVFSFIKGLMPEKIRNRMFLYSENNSNKVYKHIPKSYLPKEEGGDNGSIPDLT